MVRRLLCVVVAAKIKCHHRTELGGGLDRLSGSDLAFPVEIERSRKIDEAFVLFGVKRALRIVGIFAKRPLDFLVGIGVVPEVEGDDQHRSKTGIGYELLGIGNLVHLLREEVAIENCAGLRQARIR